MAAVAAALVGQMRMEFKPDLGSSRRRYLELMLFFLLLVNGGSFTVFVSPFGH